MQVSAKLFVCSIDIDIARRYLFTFIWQYSIPILLSSGALIKSVNNNITVTERVKARTVVLHYRVATATMLIH